MENVLGVLGGLLVLGGFIAHKGHRREVLLSLGGVLLLVYSVYIENAIFTVVMALFTVLSLVHLHHHKHK